MDIMGIEVTDMDDTISRQAAIDEIKAVYEWHDTVTVDRLIQHFKALPTVDAVPVEDVFELAIALNKKIEALELSVRAYNALSRWKCRTVGDVYALWKSGKIKKVRNLGDKSIGEIEDRLNAYLRRTEGEHGQTD